MVKERRSSAAEIIERLLKMKGMKKKELAESLGMPDSVRMSQFLNQKIKFDDAVEVINKIGFDVVIQPALDEPTLRVTQKTDVCADCIYKKFAVAIEEVSSMLHKNITEAGKELDFYTDDKSEMENKNNYIEIK